MALGSKTLESPAFSQVKVMAAQVVTRVGVTRVGVTRVGVTSAVAAAWPVHVPRE
jgi:hypothetical protein